MKMTLTAYGRLIADKTRNRLEELLWFRSSLGKCPAAF